MSKHKPPRRPLESLVAGVRSSLASSIRIRTRSLPGNAWMSFYVAVGASHTKRLLPQAAAFAIRRKPLSKVTSKKLSERQPHALTECSSLGTTTLEVKTGYGLSVDAELKHFEAIERTAAIVKPRLLKTLLAHVPPKTQSSTQYLEELSKAFSSHLGGLDFIDIFVESTAFTPDDARYFRDLIPRDIALKLHVDQLHDGDGAALASELRALSADHLEFTSEKTA